MTGLSSRHLNTIESDLLLFVLPIGLETGPSVGDVCMSENPDRPKQGPTLRPNPDQQEP